MSSLRWCWAWAAIATPPLRRSTPRAAPTPRAAAGTAIIITTITAPATTTIITTTTHERGGALQPAVLDVPRLARGGLRPFRRLGVGGGGKAGDRSRLHR